MPDQFVNLPYDKEKRQGNKIVYKVRTTVSNADNTPAPGRPIVWVLEPDPNNTEIRFLAAKERARLEHAETTSDDKAWATNTLYLPHVGGDKYKVKIYRRGDNPNTARLVEEVTTWRKIYYTVHYVGHPARALYNRIKTRMHQGFASGFVRLDEVNVAPTPEVEEDAVATSNDLRTIYKGSYPLGYKPWHARIVIAKKLVDAVTANMNVQIRATTNTAECVVTPSGNGYSVVINTPDDLLGDDPIGSLYASAFAKPAGADWQEKGASIDLKSVAQMTGAKQITVDLSGYQAQLNQALRGYADAKVMVGSVFQRRYEDGLVSLSLTFNKAGAGDSYNGHSFGNFVCVRSHRPGEGTQAEIDSAILGTFVHEIGHGLQQTVKEEQLYDNAGAKIAGPAALEKNYTVTANVNQGPWHTDDQGGQGPHCATNAKLEMNAAGTRNEWAYDATKGQLCTMYFAGDDHRNNGVFCAVCLPRLKRANLSMINMNKQKWNLY
jgi:hypothetical protein